MTHALWVQARFNSKSATTRGKSSVPGVYFDTNKWRKWRVRTLARWGPPRRWLEACRSQKEAEAIQMRFFPRLEAAAAAGKFDEEFARVKAEIVNEV